jgi:capsular exopolysaccharide synthesis family protein
VFVIVLGIVMYNTFTTQPIYEATATIMIEEENSQTEEIFGAQLAGSKSAVNNQIQYLQSISLSENVITALQNSEYASSLKILQTEDEDGNSLLNSALQKMNGSGDEPQIAPELSYNDRVRQLALRLRDWVSVYPVQETDMIKITVRAPSKNEAIIIANTITGEFMEINMEKARGEVSEVKKFLSEQLESVGAELEQAEMALKEYQESADIVALDRSTETIVEQAAEFETQYNNALAERNALETRLSYLKSQLSDQEADIVQNLAQARTPFVKALRDSIASKQVQLTVLRTDETVPKDHPYIQNLQRRLREMNAQLDTVTQNLIEDGLQIEDPLQRGQDLLTEIFQIEGQISSLESREKYLEQLVASYNEQLEALPGKSLEFARLKRDQQVNENLFILLKNRYEEARITEAGQIGNVSIVDAAIPRQDPVQPNTKRNLLAGGLLALMLGFGAAFGREKLDRTIHSVEDIEQAGIHNLAVVPRIPENAVAGSNGNGRAKLNDNLRLISHYDPTNPVSEVYRMLRTNLEFTNPDLVPKTILVTSPGAGEGKSTTAVNLAITMSHMGQQVLLVDLDLRKPVIAQTFRIRRKPGFTEALFEKETLENSVHVGAIENLSVLTSGELPGNPSELLGAQKTEEFIQKLAGHYDKIIFDAPPIIPVTDATVISRLVDATVMVVRGGQTDHKAFIRSAKQLKDISGNLAGVVLNDFNVSFAYSSYYYKNQYSYYSSSGS